MKYSYFPGCSLKGLGRAYEKSLLPVMAHLGVEVQELPDWNCCGATAYMSVDEGRACVLAARNLAIAQRQGLSVMAPCSACYLVLNKTQHNLSEYPAMRETVDRALGAVNLTLKGEVPVRHPLDILTNDIGLEAIRQKVTHPLQVMGEVTEKAQDGTTARRPGLRPLKVVPYYGCQIVRPYATFDDKNNPTTMDRLIEALGAEVVTNYRLKTKCCGGSLTGTVPDAGLRLVYILLKEALKHGADCIATVCPLCQYNLDACHAQIASRYEPVRIPTVYFSQLMGLAFGMSARDMGLQHGIIPMPPLAAPAPAPAAQPAVA